MSETYNKNSIEEMERQYPQYNPPNTGEKRKDQENITMTIITIITMTMTMIKIVGPETGIDHTTEIDHI